MERRATRLLTAVLGLAATAAVACPACILDWSSDTAATTSASGTGSTTGSTTGGGGGASPGAPAFVAAFDLSTPVTLDAVALDDSSRIYLGGVLSGEVELPNGVALHGKPPGQAFVLALDQVGAPRWGVTCVGAGLSLALGIAPTTSYGTFVTGSFAGPATCGAADLTPVDGPDAGDDGDVFLFSLADDGAVGNVRVFGGGGAQTPHAVTTDATGHASIAGEFFGHLAVGGATADDLGVASHLFVANPSGAGWVRAVGDDAGGGGAVVAMAAFGTSKLVVGGTVHGSGLDLGTGQPSDGDQDALVMAVATDDGSTVWAQRFPGSDAQSVLAVAAHEKDG
ncbi:MAG TPA: hypothetical protein VHB21_08840, partial [Minicystis sp.]|nr:hypothetical protein [Minicystis sp.]